MNTTRFSARAAPGFGFSQPVNYAANELDALQEIIQANVFIRSVRILSRIANAK